MNSVVSRQPTRMPLEKHRRRRSAARRGDPLNTRHRGKGRPMFARGSEPAVSHSSERIPWSAPTPTFDGLSLREHKAAGPRRPAAGFSATRAIVWESPAIRRVLQQAEQVAPLPSTVLLLGETGVGKEVLAKTIHELSP